MEFGLSEDQAAFVATARGFARDRLAPHAAAWDEQRHFPAEALREAARSASPRSMCRRRWAAPGCRGSTRR